MNKILSVTGCNINPCIMCSYFCRDVEKSTKATLEFIFTFTTLIMPTLITMVQTQAAVESLAKKEVEKTGITGFNKHFFTDKMLIHNFDLKQYVREVAFLLEIQGI